MRCRLARMRWWGSSIGPGCPWAGVHARMHGHTLFVMTMVRPLPAMGTCMPAGSITGGGTISLGVDVTLVAKLVLSAEVALLDMQSIYAQASSASVGVWGVGALCTNVTHDTHHVWLRARSCVCILPPGCNACVRMTSVAGHALAALGAVQLSAARTVPQRACKTFNVDTLCGLPCMGMHTHKRPAGTGPLRPAGRGPLRHSAASLQVYPMVDFASEKASNTSKAQGGLKPTLSPECTYSKTELRTLKTRITATAEFGFEVPYMGRKTLRESALACPSQRLWASLKAVGAGAGRPKLAACMSHRLVPGQSRDVRREGKASGPCQPSSYARRPAC